jgi:hypothetical protein
MSGDKADDIGEIDDDAEDENYDINDDPLQNENQAIERIADAIIDKLFDDERFKKLLTKPQSSKSGGLDNLSISLDRQKYTKSQYIALRNLIPENNNQLKSKVEKNQSFREYLTIVEILYKELSVEYTDFPVNRRVVVENRMVLLNCIDVLMRAEVFMLALLFKPLPVFIDVTSQSKPLKKETLKQLQNRMTHVGKELLFVLNNIDLIQHCNGNYFTRNMQVLSEFFNSGFKNKELTDLKFELNLDFNIDGLFRLNRLLMRLKDFADSGKLKTNKYNDRLRDGDVESSILKPSQIDVTKKWKQSSERLKTAIEYFRGYKKKDIVLYRFRLEIEFKKSESRVTHEQFQKFFTLLNKKAARPEGFSGYLSFLYFWRENFTTDNIELDLIIIVDANSLWVTNTQIEDGKGYYRDIPKEFLAYTRDVLKASLDIFDSKEADLYLEAIPILQSNEWEMPVAFIIESGDKEKWAFLEKRVLPYFIFLENLAVEYSDDIRTRFNRAKKAI